MSRIGVTYLDVERVANQISLSGEEPTIERIRRQLQTGSNSTIGRYLKTWRLKQDPLQQIATHEKIPEALILLLKGLWERVVAEADTQIDTVKTSSAQQINELKNNLQHSQQENARALQSEGQLKQTSHGLLAEKGVLTQMLSTLQLELAALNAKQEGLLQQLAEKQTHITSLQKQAEQLQANLDHYHAASFEQRQNDQQRSDQREQELAQSLQALQSENQVLKQHQQMAEKAQILLQSEYETLRATLENSVLKNDILVTKVAEISAELAKNTGSTHHLKIEHDNLSLQLKNHTTTISEMTTTNALLAQENAALKILVEEVKEQNKGLANEKWILGQEKAQISGQLKQVGAML